MRLPLQRPQRQGDAHEGTEAPPAVQEGQPQSAGRGQDQQQAAQDPGGQAAQVPGVLLKDNLLRSKQIQHGSLNKCA